jgi:hypothetical protein
MTVWTHDELAPLLPKQLAQRPLVTLFYFHDHFDVVIKKRNVKNSLIVRCST